MYYTHDRCKAAWDEEKNDSYLGDSYSKIDEWGDYWSYLAAKYPDGTKGYQKKIIDLLENEKVLQPGITVMDIGCGPGTYGLQFIERGAGFIECVDSTDGMLKQLVIRAEERKIMDKIHISNSTWDQYKDKQTFDLVFSSMSPAISEYSELIKMETYSNRKCCLVTYGAGMPRTIRGRIWEKFLGKKAESMIFDAIYPFNILYAMGRNPNMKTFCQPGESKTPVSKVLEDTIRYFKIFGRDSENEQEIIRSVIEERATDGILCEDATGYYSVIWWQVP